MTPEPYAGRAAEAAARAKANKSLNFNWAKDGQLNVARHLMHNEQGEYTGTLQYVSVESAEAMYAALTDMELLARTNAPVTDGSTMHKAIIRALEIARTK